MPKVTRERRGASKPSKRGREARDPATRPEGRPELTPNLAYQFVQLTHAGLSPQAAVGYIAPNLTSQACLDVAKDWQGTEFVFQATLTFIGRKPWHEMPADARLTLARDKHLAELAYFAYTKRFDTAGEDLGKLKYAYATIANHLAGKGAGERNPMDEFLEDVSSGRLDDTPVPVMPAGATLGDMNKARN